MFRLTLSLVFVCSCVLPVNAQSADPPEYQKWEASGFGGGSFIGKFQFPTPVFANGQERSQTVGMRYASGYDVGVRITENLGDFWSADLEYSFANQPLTFTNLSPEIQSLSLGQSLHHFSYSLSYLPLPRVSRFRPYSRVGTGASLFYIHKNSKLEAAERGLELRDSWKFLVNWGGGFKYLVADQAAVTFDVTDYLSGIPSYGLPSSARLVNGRYQPGVSRTGLMNNWQLNFGLTFQWDD